MTNFYVYVYLDPRKPGDFIYDDYKFDYEPFYVGKGKNDRYKKHMGYYDNNKYKNSKIKKITTLGLLPVIKKEFENLSESTSLLREMDMISKIGRIDLNTGPLTNFTNGGEGICGYKFSKEYLLDRYNKVVIKYNKNGDILNKYDSITEASIDNGVSRNSIIRCCNGDVKFSKNKFIYLYDSQIFESRFSLDGNKYPVNRIDMDGILTMYKSSTEASIKNNINKSNINSCCKGNRFQSGGYIWRYEKHKKKLYYDIKILEKWNTLLPFLNIEIEGPSGDIYKNILEYLVNNNYNTNSVIRHLKKNNLI